MIIAGVLVAVFVFVYILSSVGIIPFDALSSRFSTLILQDSDNFPIVVNTDVKNVCSDNISDRHIEFAFTRSANSHC